LKTLLEGFPLVMRICAAPWGGGGGGGGEEKGKRTALIDLLVLWLKARMVAGDKKK